MVTSSRRAGRVTARTKLLIYRGSDKVDLALAEVVVWENQHDGNSSSADGGKPHHVGAKGVESGELLVSRVRSTRLLNAWGEVSYAYEGLLEGQKGCCFPSQQKGQDSARVEGGAGFKNAANTV